MSKFKMTLFVVFLGLTLTSSCKNILDGIGDCLADAASISVSHTIDPIDSKKVQLEISYSGNYTLDNSITWDFGDGVIMVENGISTEHTYATTGTYSVKATVTTKNGDSTCNHDANETVLIN